MTAISDRAERIRRNAREISDEAESYLSEQDGKVPTPEIQMIYALSREVAKLAQMTEKISYAMQRFGIDCDREEDESR